VSLIICCAYVDAWLTNRVLFLDGNLNAVKKTSKTIFIRVEILHFKIDAYWLKVL